MNKIAPKEKALEIFESLYFWDTAQGYRDAKKSSINAVNLIIDSCPMYYTGFEYESDLEYWLEIKKELEKL